MEKNKAVLEVRVYDGKDDTQVSLSGQIESVQSELEICGKYNPKRLLLNNKLKSLRQRFDQRALELGTKSRFTSGSHG